MELVVQIACVRTHMLTSQNHGVAKYAIVFRLPFRSSTFVNTSRSQFNINAKPQHTREH